MARPTMLCLLLLTTSLHHVTSFAVHRRHSRSTDLADALRMLERQRRRIDNEESLLASSPQLLGDRRLTMADLEPWFSVGPGSPSDDDSRAEWLAKTLGFDGYNGVEGLPEGSQPGEFLREPPAQAPLLEMEPTDQELDAIFGEKNDDVDDDGGEARASLQAEKKDKEIMTESKGDARSKMETRSSDDVIVSDSGDDVRLTKDEFKALLKAVEKLQKQAIDKAEEEAEEAEKVAVEVEEKVAEAREEAKEAEAEAEEEKEEEEEEEEARVLTPRPQPVSKEELDNLFEEESEEVRSVFACC